MKKRRVKKGVFIILFLIVLVIFSCIYFICGKKHKNNPVNTQIEVIDSIDNFDYVLNDNETKYYLKIQCRLIFWIIMIHLIL